MLLLVTCMNTYKQCCQIFWGRIMVLDGSCNRRDRSHDSKPSNATTLKKPAQKPTTTNICKTLYRKRCLDDWSETKNLLNLVKMTKKHWIKVSDTCRHPGNLPLSVLAGSFRSLRSEGALLEGVWVQAQLQWPRRHQMGAVHRPLRHLRNSLLKVHLLRAANWPLFLPSILLRFFSSAPSYFVSLLPSVLIASLIQPHPNPQQTTPTPKTKKKKCLTIKIKKKKKVNMI